MVTKKVPTQKVWVQDITGRIQRRNISTENFKANYRRTRPLRPKGPDGKRHRTWQRITRGVQHRLTLGLNYNWASTPSKPNYRSVTNTRFYDHKPTPEEIEDFRKETWRRIKAGETKHPIGKYDPSEYWFNEELKVVDDKDAKEGFFDTSTGKPEKWEPSANQTKRFARKMIKSGKWRKPETLDKWRRVLDES